MNHTAALAQMHIEPGQVDRNLATAVAMIREAARRNASFVLLPELWSSGYDLEHARDQAAESPRIVEELIRLAGETGICIGGSLLQAAPGGLFNMFHWVDPSRPETTTYSKIHLFRLMQEEQWLQPGDTPRWVETAWGRSGLAVCYDLRFPELFRRYALEGATSFLLSSEWPVRRIEHWQILLRARAIENQACFAAVNCVGAGKTDQFGGRSAVLDPWGNVLAEGSSSEEELIVAPWNLEEVEKVRSFMPVFADRRPDLYAG